MIEDECRAIHYKTLAIISKNGLRAEVVGLPDLRHIWLWPVAAINATDIIGLSSLQLVADIRNSQNMMLLHFLVHAKPRLHALRTI